MELSQIFSAQIEKQRMEIDRFVSFQSQRLKQALKEQRKQQNALLIKKMERKTLLLLKQREEEIEKAAKRTMELQELLNRAEVEKEATFASLKSTIERLKENANLSSIAAGDAESCCRRRSEEGGMDWHWKKIICRCCNSRNSCVIMLPCRHLCSCKNCETFLDFCPVCGTVKKVSLEALI